MKIKIKKQPPLLASFETHPHLDPTVWEGDSMRSEIGQRLREIAEEFIEKLDLQSMKILDIILTGSLANYNWSKYSDLDVHIVIDFRAIDENEGLVKKYFDAVRSNWNRAHDIKVKGYEVELYVQDADETHESTGVYSLLNDEWVLKPEPFTQNINKAAVYKKVKQLVRDIDKTDGYLGRQRYGDAIELGNKTKTKIKKMRQAGLERSGVASTENFAFKVLRRSGYMKKLFDSVREAYDEAQSLTEQE
jgi:predicted nucleotidyltransferase